MFIVSCPVEFFSPSGATSDVPRCRSLRSLGGLFLRNYKHFAPLGLRPQNPLVPGKFFDINHEETKGTKMGKYHENSILTGLFVYPSWSSLLRGFIFLSKNFLQTQ